MRFTKKHVSLITSILVILTSLLIPSSKFVHEQAKLSPTHSVQNTPTGRVHSRTDTLLEEIATVVKVVDGDTMQVQDTLGNHTIRLIGINTPETVDPRLPVECFGKEASSKAKELLTGKSVRLEPDPSQANKDKYNRFLRYVYLLDGTNINLVLIASGYAYEYTYDTPYKYQQAFKKAQTDAEASQLGLWNKNTCNGIK